MTASAVPAALLRRGAAKVRELAAEASAGPWRNLGSHEEVPGFPSWEIRNGRDGMDEHAVAFTFALSPHQSADAAWITALSPALSEPLAALLDDAARWAPQTTTRANAETPIDLAVNLARALLGEPPSQPDQDGGQ